MRYTARLIGLDREEREQKIAASLAHVGLSDVVDKRVQTFSRGMRQRLGLAEILMKDAQIAILDEPTSGLDPQATLELLEIIRDLKQRGVSVLLSSHLLERVQSVCDRVALFNEGSIVLMGTVPELGRQVLGGGFNVDIEAEGQGFARTARGRVPGCRRSRRRGRTAAAVRRPRRAAGSGRLPPSPPAGAYCGSRSRSRASRRSIPAISRMRPAKESAMRREGSALHGLGVVILKELTDHLTSVRMRVLEWLVVLFAIVGALWRDPADQGRDRRGSVPVPAAVHDRARTAAFIRVVPELPGAADRDRSRLRRRSMASTAAARFPASWRSRSIATRCCSGNSSPGFSRCRSA